MVGMGGDRDPWVHRSCTIRSEVVMHDIFFLRYIVSQDSRVLLHESRDGAQAVHEQGARRVCTDRGRSLFKRGECVRGAWSIGEMCNGEMYNIQSQ